MFKSYSFYLIKLLYILIVRHLFCPFNKLKYSHFPFIILFFLHILNNLRLVIIRKLSLSLFSVLSDHHGTNSTLSWDSVDTLANIPKDNNNADKDRAVPLACEFCVFSLEDDTAELLYGGKKKSFLIRKSLSPLSVSALSPHWCSPFPCVECG